MFCSHLIPATITRGWRVVTQRGHWRQWWLPSTSGQRKIRKQWSETFTSLHCSIRVPSLGINFWLLILLPPPTPKKTHTNSEDFTTVSKVVYRRCTSSVISDPTDRRFRRFSLDKIFSICSISSTSMNPPSSADFSPGTSCGSDLLGTSGAAWAAARRRANHLSASATSPQRSQRGHGKSTVKVELLLEETMGNHAKSSTHCNSPI